MKWNGDYYIYYSDETVVEVHAKQGCGDGFVGVEVLLNDFLDDGLCVWARGVIESDLEELSKCHGKSHHQETQSYWYLHCLRINYLKCVCTCCNVNCLLLERVVISRHLFIQRLSNLTLPLFWLRPLDSFRISQNFRGSTLYVSIHPKLIK